MGDQQSPTTALALRARLVCESLGRRFKSYHRSFIRPRLVSLGLSLNRTPVGIAGEGLVVSALPAGVCGRCPLAGCALCSGGARVPRLVAGPRPVLSEGSGASETPPDAEKPVHTREPVVSPVRVGQPSGRKSRALRCSESRLGLTFAEV